MKLTEQTVYLPVPDFKTSKLWVSDKETEQLQFVKEEQGHFFTPEQLNEYTASVIEKALETAAEKAEPDYWKGDCQLCGSNVVDKKSITDTFDTIFKEFEV